MPKGTRVSRCVEKVKKSKDEGAAIAICQASTKQGYATGRSLKEAAPLVAGAVRLIGPALLRRGAVATGRGAAQGTARRVGARAARKAAKNPKAIGAMGTAGEAGYEALKAQRASDTDLEETKMNNAYINKLMETRSPESRAKTRGRKELGTHGRKGKLTGKTSAEVVARGLGQSAAKDIGKARTRETAANKKITRGKQEVFAKRSDKRFEDGQRIFRHEPGTYKPKMRDHTEYHQIGLVMADAMGLNEKTRLQKEVEKKSTPHPGGFGKTAEFKTSGGKKVKVQDYKASRGGGAGSQAQSRAIELSRRGPSSEVRRKHNQQLASKGRKSELAKKADSVARVRKARDPLRGARPVSRSGKVSTELQPTDTRRNPPEDVLVKRSKDRKKEFGIK